MKWFYVTLCVLMLCVTANAQNPSKDAPKDVPAAAANEVPGLKLPPPQTVNYDEGFVSLQADCAGPVKWLVLSTSAKIRFNVNPATPNFIDVAIMPYEGVVTVFCIGVVDGKLTEYARTDITVTGPPAPGPGPNPNPNPNPNPAPAPNLKLPLHLSIIEDPLQRTDAIRDVVNNQQLFKTLRNKQVIARVYTTTDPILATKKFDVAVKKYGAPIMILQDDTGQALVIGPLSRDSNALLQMIGPYVGGFNQKGQ